MTKRRNLVTESLADWLPLVEPTGPFLTLPVLKRAFPNGLERVGPEVRAEMRQRLETLGNTSAERSVWLRWVFTELLQYKGLLREGQAVPDALEHTVPEHGVTLKPDFALVSPATAGAPAGTPRLLIEVYEAGTKLTERLPGQRWAATPIERMALLCRATGVELGLVTDTNTFTLIWAPRGSSLVTATWLASLWSEERGLFDAFTSLLGARRFFAVAKSDTLEALLAESSSAQVEVTNQLGLQVRKAVELMVDALSRANLESGGRLLDNSGTDDVESAEEAVYGAAVTVMMRLVFMLYAEERHLFPLGDDLYDQSYAVSTLYEVLRQDADLYGEEVLERRTAAWHRLLATFRMVYDGVQHETLRIPAYGGSLFDPNRYPFLEGRQTGESEKAGPATPPAVSDRSVMAILGALQWLSFKGENRRVSYRSLDVEQIGHVYERLLDHGCRIVDEIMVGLVGREEPEVGLADIERAAAKGKKELLAYLKEATGMSGSKKLEQLLDQPMDASTRRYLLEAVDNEQAIFDRVAPYVGVLRRDLRDLPVVFLEGAICVTQTSSRRDSGTEYTTRELADEIVGHTLEPLVYSPGPADGAPPEQWKLKTAKDILDLRVCDPAVGSGAILVAACRYLAERLIDAWTAEGSTPAELLGDEEGITTAALRTVVDHCIFGVDVNPMAVEMAKLSLWLVTMAKDRPFTFLDHAVQCGDSLLGITNLDQLEYFHMDPARGETLHADLFQYTKALATVVAKAVANYERLADIRVVTVRDADAKARLFHETAVLLDTLRLLGDSIVGAALATAGEGTGPLDVRLAGLAPLVEQMVSEDTAKRKSARARLARATTDDLDVDHRNSGHSPKPLHWPLAFPHVFLRRSSGFDAIVGNPPFLGGKRISGALGKRYREFLVHYIAQGRKGNADLAAYFFIRAAALLTQDGAFGLLATNTIAQGDTREVGLDWLLQNNLTIYRAEKSRPWPGSASLEIANVWARAGDWHGPCVLNGSVVSKIASALDPASRVAGLAQRLAANRGKSYNGSFVNGMGFVLTPDEAHRLIKSDPNNRRVIQPYLNGEDLNSDPKQRPSRYIINFFDWPLLEAKKYPTCFAIVRAKVKPERDKVNRAAHRERWWQYGDKRPALYGAIADLKRVLAIAATSKTVMPVFVPKGRVYSHALYIFTFDDDFHLGVLSSAFHWWWAVTRASTMRTDIRYTPTDCFETFPFPTVTKAVAEIASKLASYRAELMVRRNIGLTSTYNLVHSADTGAKDISGLRDMHVELDHAVAAAYSWHDVPLGHGFHETSQGVRFTVSNVARIEILDRLLELNHARYAEEVRLGLHEKGNSKASKKTGKRSAKLASAVVPDLFDLASDSAPTSSKKR